MPKLTKAQQSQQKLLMAAFVLLKDGGVKSLSAANIAKQAGLSKSTFFHHFAQIEDFYIYILDSIIAGFNQQASKEQFDSYENYIRFSLAFAFKFIEQSPEVFTALLSFMDQSRNKPETMTRFKSMCKNNVATWANYLKPLLPNGFDEQKTNSLAYMIDMHFIGLCQHYLIDPNKKRFTQITEDFILMIALFVNNENKR